MSKYDGRVLEHLDLYLQSIPPGIEAWKPKKIVLDIDYECCGQEKGE